MVPEPVAHGRSLRSSDHDLQLVADLFNTEGAKKDLAFLKWQYVEKQSGAIYVDGAVADDRLAALYAVRPCTEGRVDGARTNFAQSLDTLTHQEFRGQGWFIRLANSVYDRLREADFALVYGFPNGSSAPGFFTKLGWVNLDPVPLLVRPIRIGYVLQRARHLGFVNRLFGRMALPIVPVRSRGISLREVTDFGDDFDTLWEDFSAEVRVAIGRTSDYLISRISNRPGNTYTTVGAYRGDQLVGFVCYTVLPKHGGEIGYVLELLHAPLEPRIGSLLLGHTLRVMKAAGADVALAWCLEHSPNRTAFRRSGFLTLPERLRPIELHFGALALDERCRDAIADRKNWYLSYCDSDTV